MQSVTSRKSGGQHAVGAALLALALALLVGAGTFNIMFDNDHDQAPADRPAARSGALTQSELATLGDTAGSPGSIEQSRTDVAQLQDLMFLDQNLYLPDQGAQVAVPAGLADEPSFASTEEMLFWEQNVYLPSQSGEAAYQSTPSGLPVGFPELDGPLTYEEMLFLEQNIWE